MGTEELAPGSSSRNDSRAERIRTSQPGLHLAKQTATSHDLEWLAGRLIPSRPGWSLPCSDFSGNGCQLAIPHKRRSHARPDALSWDTVGSPVVRTSRPPDDLVDDARVRLQLKGAPAEARLLGRDL